jgi:hypothetical protein
MPREPAVLALLLVCAVPVRAQEVHADIGYAHIFRAGGFSFATSYLRGLNAPAAAARHRVGGEFWYANTDVASRPAGNASRSVVGLGARYEIELAECCGKVHPVAAVPVRLIHSSIPDVATLQTQAASLLLLPRPGTELPSEDRNGSAWGWGAGVELGVRVVLSPQWNLQTSGTAMYQDVYAGSTTSGAWTWHVGLGYRFGS